MAGLLDKFVCVRIIQCWGMDLSLFQFDPDLTWAVFFLNADRTIYGRYGTRSSREAIKDISVDGFKKAMEGALEVHKGYPANKSSLVAKTGPAPRWKTPEKIPALPQKAVPADGTRANCIHCHAIGTGEILSLRKQKEAIADNLLWGYGKPDLLGLTLDVKERAKVQKVWPDSPAEKAGFRTGDEITHLDGQPVISIADVQWVLQNAKEPSQVRAKVNRDGKTVDLMLPLANGWRRGGDFTWRTTTWALRFRIAGMRLSNLPAAERKKQGLANDVVALRIDELAPGFVQDRNQAPAKIGLQKGDIIVAVDGKEDFVTESQFLAYLVQEKQPGDKVKLTTLRGGQKRELELPVQ